MTSYQRINNITGWLIFLIASAVYILTIEPVASFWDCAEFIASAYKLQVPHPAGAPMFLLIGRMFSMFASSNVESVGFAVNLVSALSSGFTILFLFWSINLIAHKILKIKVGEATTGQTIKIIAAGAIGSLAFTFSDSFWWSAVEAEVYAMSSFLTALVFWAMLKWDVISDEAEANKWLVLIGYIIGISIGVHLLNIVALPALGLIYYFKKYEKVTFKGILFALLISGGILILIWRFIILGVPALAGKFEIFFINVVGLPFGFGALIFGLLLIGGFTYGIIYAIKKNKVTLHTFLLAFSFILIGYSSYFIVPIRSSYDPPIDQNDPENVMTLLSYLNRDQYGSRPLLHGQYFDAQVTTQEKGDPIYTKGEEEYEITDYKIETNYDPNRTTILPRMYSGAPGHAEEYRSWTGLKPNEVPNFADNITFLIRYQLGHMYFRYLMWNFAGRESDIEGAGWQTMFQDSSELPEVMKENKARNNFWMLPFILGVVGLIFHYNKNVKSFSVIGLLFILTGVALILYLNSPATEPRERDYIYAGSYYAFAFWIGFGVLAVASLLEKAIKNPKMAGAIAGAICLVVPGIMAAEGWDDHDRSDRYFSVDAARNYLASCAPNAILFTGGDNDTFPLWFIQEVEDYRTDVRVIVLSYFNTDWYINQMRQNSYDSEPIPMSLTPQQVQQGGLNDYLPYVESAGIQGAIPLERYMELIRSNNPGLQIPTSVGKYNMIPSKSLSLSIDKQNVRNLGIIPEDKMPLLVDKMTWNIQGNGLEKKDLMILDIMNENKWKRPIYFNTTSLNGIKMNLKKYVVQEGLAYRLLPIANPNMSEEFVNTEVMYKNLMKEFSFTNTDDPDVYYNENYRNFFLNHRSAYTTLSKSLLAEGDDTRAVEVIDYIREKVSEEAVPLDITALDYIQIYYATGHDDKANELVRKLWDQNVELLGYLVSHKEGMGYMSRERQISFAILQQTLQILRQYNKNEEALQYQDELRVLYEKM
ncbi:membrane protein [Marivirga lumbricoides]|uniref:Membrane protein n=1 Tax=Marivirga lumbricoides TaxID=1046115 RepID=A0ABQ1N780_9BACT|nr:membrane protein [Marivirga lumbricoides]